VSKFRTRDSRRQVDAWYRGKLGTELEREEGQMFGRGREAVGIFREDADWVLSVALQPKHGEGQIIVFSSPKKCARSVRFPTLCLRLWSSWS
jgi:hypothetical protein